MPWDEVMGKFKRGELHSGSDKGPQVKSRQQAIAIMMSEKRKAAEGKKEYQAHAKGGTVKYQGGGDTTRIPPRMPTPTAPSTRGIPPVTRSPMGPPSSPGVSIPIPNTGGRGTLIVPDRGREEWQPQLQSGLHGSMQPMQRGPSVAAAQSIPTTGIPPISTRPTTPTPMGGATGQWKRGGTVKKFQDGGDTTLSVKPATPPVKPPSPPPSKPSSKGGSDIKVLPGAPDTQPTIYPMVQAKKGGLIAHKKGGEVCTSNAKQMKQNMVETAVNRTGPVGLEKGGEVWKKPSWRRW